MKIRDNQRSKVYKAEQAVRKELNNIEMKTLNEVKGWVSKIMQSYWMKKNYPYAQRKAIRIKDGRGTRVARGGLYSINLPKWARHKTVILHEMAHVICEREYWKTSVAAHGREWANIYINLLKRWYPEVAELMIISYYLHKVKWHKSKQK